MRHPLSFFQHAAVMITRALNKHVVQSGTPGNQQSFRGTSIPSAELAFFTVAGRKYRAPMFIASSFDKHIATGFMNRSKQKVPENEPVMFTFNVPAECKHVNRLEGLDEQEYLFTTYTGFMISSPCRSVIGADGASYHEVIIDVALDNKAFPSDADLCKWH